MIIIVYGVSGAGKTTVGIELANELDWKFYDADDFHSAANIAKMKSGIPLTDDDRRAWLQSLRELIIGLLREGANAVLACSALKQNYRDELRVDDDVKLVLLYADYDDIAKRLDHRVGHFMNPTLLKSQFDTLEMPDGRDTVLDATLSPEELAGEIKQKLVETG